MIAVKLQGRLGNQLFQYAFAYTAARKLKTSFYMDRSDDNFLLPVYFDIADDWKGRLDLTLFSIRGYRNLFRVNVRAFFYQGLRHLLFVNKKKQISNKFPPGLLLATLENNCLYEGYFQSLDYFDDYKTAIRKLYQIKAEHKLAFNQLLIAEGLLKKKVVVHIRRTDYVDLKWSLPLSYYKDVLSNLDLKEVDLIFISDDPDFVKTEFDYLPDKYVSHQNEIVDLQFLINADICILANSSFSWWGAWLNNRPEVVIYCPENYSGSDLTWDFPENIYPNEWTRISY